MLGQRNTSVVQKHSLRAIDARRASACSELQISGKVCLRRLPSGLWISHILTSPFA